VPVQLRPLADDEFVGWRERTLRSYVDELVGATGMTADAARDRAERQLAEMLPEGPRTPGHHVMAVLVEQADTEPARVGTAWLGPHPDRADAAWVYDVSIDADRRGRGLGRGAMLALEHLARTHGHVEIGLNVFGPNRVARGLYDSLGYRVVATTMGKRLDPGG
jgi:GNAT superfamily N-acetyltransferase